MPSVTQDDAKNDLKTTPLTGLHRELGARMVPFAGYDMPVQYSGGILAEHRHTREAAGLFDVSHMGQVRVTGADAATGFEALVPGDIQSLDAGRMRYTQFTNHQGGILDDLMVTRFDDHLFVVVNAAVKDADIALMRDRLGAGDVEVLSGRALIALQGPRSAEALSVLAPAAEKLGFMNAAPMAVANVDCLVSRSGYTGEDGFEISLPAGAAEDVARRLLDHPAVGPVGLGARDSLRLEAGLCLYGHDIDETTTPVEAGLAWSIGKRRRAEGGFPGAAVIQSQLQEGAERRRVGIVLEGRAPAREGAEIQDMAGATVGKVTSGGFSPVLGAAVAMGYVASGSAAADTPVQVVVRGRALAGRVTKMPFVPARYHKQ